MLYHLHLQPGTDYFCLYQSGFGVRRSLEVPEVNQGSLLEDAIARRDFVFPHGSVEGQ